MPLARIALCLFLAAGLLAAARGATSVCHEGYTVCTWQTEDGLPQNTVTTITQTRDGYLWVGTLNGLARFDGVRFQVFDRFNTPALRDGRVTALHEDAAGVLWIGRESGELTRYRDGVFEALPNAPASHDAVNAIGDDATGSVWILRNNGALESIDGRSAGPPHPQTQTPLLGFARTAGGEIWAAIGGALRTLHEGKLVPVNLGPASRATFVYGIGASRGNGVWVARDEQLRVWKNGAWDPQRESYRWPGSAITRIVERRTGGLAVGSMANGLYLLFGDGRVVNFTHRNSRIQNWTRVVYEDREGNLWLGAGSGGLAVIRASGLSLVNPPDEWQGRTTLAVAPGPERSLWIGTEGAGLYRLRDGQWTRFAEEQGLSNLYVWALEAEPDGRMLAGTWSGGLFRQNGERFERVRELGPIGAPLMALKHSPADAAHWVATGNGLWRLAAGKPAEAWREPHEAATLVCAVERDPRGAIWLALPERGLGRVVGEAITVWGQREGLSSNSAQCLLADGDTLWIGTRDAGLNRLRDGKFAAIDRARGLVSNVICHIADDQRGNLWLSTHHGIMRIAKEELHRCADGALATVGGRVFDKSDGLPTLEFSGGLQAAGCLTADGRLWFTSNKGVVSVDPAAIETNATPPPVVIEALSIDGHMTTPEAASTPLQLSPGHHRLEFHYTALTLTDSGKALFKHRLVGLDRDWIDAGTKRVATYSQLSPGEYRFQVVACNRDRVWNLAGATLAFTVPPFYWQTWWFRSAIALAVLSAVAWAVRFVTRRRMQRRVRELEYERGIERERARIAQDIHDDIGSSLTRISMLSQSLRAEIGQPPRAATLLERIHATTIEVTAALDEIVWAVNPRHDTLDSLVSYMAKFAQETLAAAQVRCRLDLPVNLPPWPLNTHTRHNVILAFKEALHNTLKHAGATEVRVSLALRPAEFTVLIEDNGRGFDPASAVHSGRNGLSNLQQRLQQIGGRCEIDARPGRGVTVRFIVPSPTLTLPRP